MNTHNRPTDQSEVFAGTLYKYKVALLVDDNFIDNFIAKQMLTSCHFSKEIHIAINGQLALDLLQKLSSGDENEECLYPDIIFVDLNMPVMNGIDFLREFKQKENDSLKKCKIVVLTSSIHDIDKYEVQKIDSSIMFLYKPLTAKMLNSL